jgi:Mg-chelatase subunit ChlI
MLARHSLSLVELITLSLSKLPLPHRMVSNDNDKRKMEEEEEAESLMAARKLLRHTDDNSDDDDSSDSPQEEPEKEEEVSSEVSSLNQLDTSEEKLYARHARGYLFGDDDDTPSTSSDTPPTPESH